MDNSAKNFFKVLALGLIILVGLVVFSVALDVKENFGEVDRVEITNFEECVAAGNPVMESFPRQCRTGEGDHFVEDIEDLFLQYQ